MSLTTLLAQAAAQGATQKDPRADVMQMVTMFVIMGVVMYFVMIRPQRMRQKQMDTLLKSLKAGDKVVTSSGIVGVVLAVKERTVTLRTADTKMELLKSSVAEITERSSESSES